MQDGKGQLADGTKYLRESGEDFGPNGFWRRWTCLKGVSAAGKVPCPQPTHPQHVPECLLLQKHTDENTSNRICQVFRLTLTLSCLLQTGKRAVSPSFH